MTATNKLAADVARTAIGGNGAPAMLDSFVKKAFDNLKSGDAANRRGVQMLAYACMAQHHQDIENMFHVVPGQGTPSFTSMVDKDGVAQTTGAAFKTYALRMFSLFIPNVDKLEKGEVSEAHDRAVQLRRTQEQNMRNGLALAAELVAGGVDHSAFDRAKSLFVVPLEMLCIRGMSPRKQGIKVALDGMRHRIFADQGDASMAINANVAQLKRALASKQPKPRVTAPAADAGNGTTQPDTATPTTAPQEGKSGAQPSTSADAVTSMPSFDRMVQEAARIILSDTRAKVVIADMPAETWNALQTIATFVMDVNDWTQEDAEKVATPAAATA